MESRIRIFDGCLKNSVVLIRGEQLQVPTMANNTWFSPETKMILIQQDYTDLKFCAREFP